MQVESGQRLWSDMDPAIKLFGRDIPFTSMFTVSEEDGQSEAMCPEEKDTHMNLVFNKLGSSFSSNEGEEGTVTCTRGVLSCILESSVIPSPCAETINVGNFHSLTSEKTSKKTDKIIPCPRCESLDTKFCYFNNYNANQPRHFCRKCQRYWTAGGSLRNVPFGAGRRKHKQPTPHPRHGEVSETLKGRGYANNFWRPISGISLLLFFTHALTLRNRNFVSTAQRLHHRLATPCIQYDQQMRQQVSTINNCEMDDLISPFSKSCESTFGHESPFCSNVAARVAMPNHQSLKNCQINMEGEQEDMTLKEHKLLFQSSDLSIADDKHDVVSVSASINAGSSASENPTATHLVEFSHQGEEEDSLCSRTHVKHGEETDSVSKAYKGSADMGDVCELDAPEAACSPNLWHCTGAAPGAMSASLPWPFMYPPAMWGPLYNYWAGSWAALQWGQAAAAMMQHSGVGSSVRKHQRDSGQSDGHLCIPKTLRIDNPADAARSSIWTTLGLTDRPPSSLFGDAKLESDKANSVTPIRLSNPAAFSRSAAFNESS